MLKIEVTFSVTVVTPVQFKTSFCKENVQLVIYTRCYHLEKNTIILNIVRRAEPLPEERPFSSAELAGAQSSHPQAS